ncbi:MAG: GTPase HflX [Pseudomonadota bacterium]
MSSELIDRSEPVVAAGIVIPWINGGVVPDADRESETLGLVQALGCESAFLTVERIRKASPSHLFTSGVLQRVKLRLEADDCSILVVDGALTPIQQRNLEKALGIKVIDRTGLILEIFGLRARTKEGVIQVELARLLYERSRLVRTWTHLERQRGGRGFLAGPGESQLESDRRMLDGRLKRLRGDLDDVRRTRDVQRANRRRSGKPVVALVGYTNAGKSTLFNRLTGANVFARDMPFATLDPTIRRLDLPTMGEVALIDTVGFITDLPTHLIDSFQATLEESLEADLLVHVRDRASPRDGEQNQDVLNVLSRLETETGLPLPPMIEAWNKADRLDSDRRKALELATRSAEDPAGCVVSALTGDGMEGLIALIERTLANDIRTERFHAGPEQGQARAWLYEHGDVLSDEPLENGASTLTVRLQQEDARRFHDRFPDVLPA